MLPISYFLLTAIITPVIDFIWLGFVANKLYISEIGKLLRRNSSGEMAPLWTPALLIYLVIPLAIYLFVLPKVVEKSLLEAFVTGALFGACTYAIYDLTNLATLNGWSVKITIIDILWGAFLCGSVTTLVLTLAHLLMGK